MRAAIYTYDLLIAAIMMILVAVLVYSNFLSDSYSNDLLVMQNLAKDVAKIYVKNGICPDNIIPIIYSYRIFLNDQQKCSRGDLGQVSVSVSIPIAEQRKNMISEDSPYFYRTCQNRDQNNQPIYRCSVYSEDSLDNIINNYQDYLDLGYVKVVISR